MKLAIAGLALIALLGMAACKARQTSAEAAASDAAAAASDAEAAASSAAADASAAARADPTDPTPTGVPNTPTPNSAIRHGKH